jgi:GNAT superfamily N-acetyltransferase
VSTKDLADKALDIDDANHRLGNEVYEAAGATFVRNRQAPDIYDANHVASIRVTTDAQVDELFRRVDEDFADCAHRRFDTDHRTYPPLIARLRLDGFERSEGLAMVLEGDLIGRAREHDIRPVETDDDWAAFEELKVENWAEARRKQERPLDLHVGRSMAGVRRSKCPPTRYYLAYVDGEPAGFFNAWSGVGGIGQVEDLFTLPRYRNLGIATALIHTCVAESRAGGARTVVIFADPSDTPMHIYAQMGFRPVAVVAQYTRQLKAS